MHTCTCIPSAHYSTWCYSERKHRDDESPDRSDAETDGDGESRNVTLDDLDPDDENYDDGASQRPAKRRRRSSSMVRVIGTVRKVLVLYA